uniref:Ubiquitin carboxyl-terminal hydrolase n=1 Tax=Elaeophora elaphi TaxID=1147741 RepID=A0A0R3RPG2_9BILA
MFERMSFSPPSEKRSRQSELLSDVKTKSSPPSDERTKSSPSAGECLKLSSPQSEESEKNEKDQRNPIFLEYRKREHSPMHLTSMRTLDDYKKDDFIIKPTTSKEKIFGFANLGNTCYMNAMLQGLFAMDIFARDLFKLCKKTESRTVNLDEIMPMSLALSSLASVRDNASLRRKRELLQAIKDVSRFKGSAQQDANEFLVHVLNQVHDECDRVLGGQYGIEDSAERRMRNPVMANFGFTMQSTIICDMCHHVSRIDEDSIILPVTINVLDQASERFSKKFLRFPNVQTLLDEFLKTENVERNCELCKGKSGQRTQKFVQLPRCLIIFIKRYTYDASKSVKRQDKIDIPLYLTLNGHCTESSVPFPAVPSSTKKIDFATVSPIKTKRLTTETDAPSPARRRLHLSEIDASDDIQNVSATEAVHPAIPNRYDGSINCKKGNDKSTEIRAIAKELRTRGFKKPSFAVQKANTDIRSDVSFVVPDNGSSLKGEDQLTEDIVLPWDSAEGFKRVKSPGSITCEELSRMTEEEQLKVVTVCERSLLQTEFMSNDYKSSDSSSVSLEFPEVEVEEEEDEAEIPRAQTDDICSARKDKSEEKSNSDIGLSEEIGDEQAGRSGQEVQSVSQQEEGNSNQNRIELNNGSERRIVGFIRRMAMEKEVEGFVAKVDVEQFVQGDCETKPGFAEKSHARQSSITNELQETQSSGDYAIKNSAAKNFNALNVSLRRVDSPVPDVQKAIEDKREQTRPSTPVPPNTPTSTTEQDPEEAFARSISSDDDREILEESGTQIQYKVIPYKPMSSEKRRVVCSQIGLLFNYDCIEKTAVRIMSPGDRPTRVAGIVGDGNCLFRALAFYFAGSDTEHWRVRECIVQFEAEHCNEFAALKGWSPEVWNDHMNHLLTDSTWGSDIELFAIASMLNVDVWTYYDEQWTCYRPRFKVKDGDTIPISVKDHRVGNNDGIYLLNEFNHYTPVLEPSNALLLMEGADERICDLVVNANEGFMKPSYRLVSLISHIGEKSESGHYVCDIWCKKSKGWLVCNDENVLAISESRVRARNNVGYIYFYLNR